MYDYEEEDEDESNYAALTPSPHATHHLNPHAYPHQQKHHHATNLTRSKSYDLKLNFENDEQTLNISNEESANKSKANTNILSVEKQHQQHSNNNNGTSSNVSSNEHTKIMVTSFAPEPKQKLGSLLSEIQLRPSSYQYAPEANQQKAENYENNL